MPGQVLPRGQEVEVLPGDGQLVVIVLPVLQRGLSRPGEEQSCSTAPTRAPHSTARPGPWGRGVLRARAWAGVYAVCSPRLCPRRLQAAGSSGPWEYLAG